MGLYEGIKDVAKVVQQADNIGLYKQLLDLSAQALDMQSEIARLKAENEELEKANDIESRIERHAQPYLTLKDDEQQIKYCATCWGEKRNLIQLHWDDVYNFRCSSCKNRG